MSGNITFRPSSQRVRAMDFVFEALREDRIKKHGNVYRLDGACMLEAHLRALDDHKRRGYVHEYPLGDDVWLVSL